MKTKTTTNSVGRGNPPERKPVTLERVYDCAEVLTDICIFNQDTLSKLPETSLIDMDNFQLDLKQQVAIFETARIELLKLTKLMNLARVGAKKK